MSCEVGIPKAFRDVVMISCPSNPIHPIDVAILRIQRLFVGGNGSPEQSSASLFQKSSSSREVKTHRKAKWLLYATSIRAIENPHRGLLYATAPFESGQY
jgi:hypothetical protein